MEIRILHERYEIQRDLGRKAGRQVWLALDLETQELVVVKLLLFGTDFNWTEHKLFKRGVQTLQALSHPAIPRYLDYFNLDLPEFKGFALVQTYIAAKSIQAHLNAGRTFSEAEVKQLAKDLLEILIYLHGRQPPVIHRDIKPSNILLGERSGNSVGQVYLVDFDSVQTATREVGTRTVVGTYGYMPPEQFGGRAVPASDLYGLGATLIHLVTGCDPADLRQIDMQIQFEQAANLNPTLSRWLTWMTQPSLDKRLSSAKQALQALEKPQPNFHFQKTFRVDSLRPESSKIFLHKDANYLEIFIPSLGLQFEKVSFWVSLVMFILGVPLLAIVLISTLSTITKLVFQIFSLDLFFNDILLLWALFYKLLLGVLIGIFGIILTSSLNYLLIDTTISIDQQKISRTYKFWIFGKTRTAKRRDISKLSIRFVDGDEHGHPKYWVLTIRAGKKTFNIIENPTINSLEIKWLARELSKWLELPISRD